MQPAERPNGNSDNDRRTFLAGVAAFAGAAGAVGAAGVAAMPRTAFAGDAPVVGGAPHRHSFRLSALAPQLVTPAGTRTQVTAREFPALRGMSLAKLAIEPGCFREPHWHANADELGCCTAGEILVTMFSSGNRHDTFRVKAGEMYLVPSGSLHALENVGAGRAEVLVAFSHERPEDFGMSGAVGSMTAAVMGNAWGMDASALSGITHAPVDVAFGKSDGSAEVPAAAGGPNAWKFAVEATKPLIGNDFGSARVARSDTWPALRTQSMYSLRLGGNGMREPHWHPETAEMGYVLAGRSRMTVKSPADGAGALDTYEIGPGDMYFIPKGYPHHIENLGSDELHFLIFFDRAMPEDIGYTGGIPAFPRRMVAPTLGTTERALPRYPEPAADAMIVKKRNPVGP
jgi:oxalate decarboxylase